MYALNATTTDNRIIAQTFDDTTWLRYFDPAQALAAVAAHVATLPSSRTPEQYTRSAYVDSLKYFLNWCGSRLDTATPHYQQSTLQDILAWSITLMPLPTSDLMLAYSAHLAQKGLKANTIGQKYFAPLRHYLKALTKQMIPVSGAERDFVYDCREHIRNALDVKPPRRDTTTNLSPLYQHGVRLELMQVNGVLRAINRATKAGSRDYAILHCAFSTGFRLAELTRITLASITEEGGHILITVRGKRSNYDPIPITRQLYDDILAYVAQHNAGLSEDDPRYITEHTPLWQPYLHGDHYMSLQIETYDPKKGFSETGIRKMITRRVEAILGPVKSRTGKRFSAHDTRRTFAYLADSSGMKRKDISAAMRHHNVSTTDTYIGQSLNYEDWLLGKRVKFG